MGSGPLVINLYWIYIVGNLDSGLEIHLYDVHVLGISLDGSAVLSDYFSTVSWFWMTV